MSRERSRSPREDEPNFPLILQIPQSVLSSLSKEEFLAKVQAGSRVRRVHLSSNATSSLADCLIYIYDASLRHVMRAYRATVKQLLKDDASRGEVTMHIPDNMVSFIIGKGGRQIFKLQSRSNTEISVLDAIKDFRERQVRIRGRLNDIDLAVEDIYHVILNYRLGKKEAEPVFDSATTRFVIPSSSTGYIIGRGGAFTKHFRADYRVEIKVVEGQRPPCADHESIVVLLGRPKDCYYAVDQLVTHITEAVRNTSEASSNDETKLLISPALAEKLLALNGEALKEIAKKSRCTLKIVNEADITRDKSILVSITGHLDSRIDATKAILMRTDEFSRSLERHREMRSPKRVIKRSPKRDHTPSQPEREHIDKPRDTTRSPRERANGKRKRSRSRDSQESRDSKRRRRSSSTM
mmetsp:Transcript_7945/g.15454  ORF Transcript_7945/g.15454 Transcript_7945/m.15454 type:complete len:410 (+) Transcript_7945:3212-4441(+)